MKYWGNKRASCWHLTKKRHSAHSSSAHLWVWLALRVDEGVDPERGPEPNLVDLCHHSLGVRKLVRIKLCITITTLPVVINLEVAMIEPVLDNIPKKMLETIIACVWQKVSPGKAYNDRFIDVNFVLSPGWPDRKVEHPLIRNGEAVRKRPRLPCHVLEHVFGIILRPQFIV